MTTSPVMGITEEILGEIERAGWKLVPVEPTPEMLAATSWPGCAGADYAKMISAAPAAPIAQDQVALPDGITISKDFFGTVHIKLGDFDFIQIKYDYRYTYNSHQEWVASRIVEAITAPPAAEQPDTVSDLGLRHTAPWDSARVGDYNAGWNDRHMAGMRDGEQPDTAKVDHRNIAELLLSIGWKDSSDAQWDRLRNAIPELRALLAGGAE